MNKSVVSRYSRVANNHFGILNFSLTAFELTAIFYSLLSGPPITRSQNFERVAVYNFQNMNEDVV